MSVSIRLLVLALFASFSAAHAEEVARTPVEMWRAASCECCADWARHLEANGFAVKINSTTPSVLERLKREAGIGEKLSSCHTARIAGYHVEGHVPASDIKRLLAEKPDAVGLTVPGMPIGSPGMERGDTIEPYDVLLMKKDGSTEVFARH